MTRASCSARDRKSAVAAPGVPAPLSATRRRLVTSPTRSARRRRRWAPAHSRGGAGGASESEVQVLFAELRRVVRGRRRDHLDRLARDGLRRRRRLRLRARHRIGRDDHLGRSRPRLERIENAARSSRTATRPSAGAPSSRRRLLRGGCRRQALDDELARRQRPLRDLVNGGRDAREDLIDQHPGRREARQGRTALTRRTERLLVIGQLARQRDEAALKRLQLRGVVAHHTLRSPRPPHPLDDPHEPDVRRLALEQDVEPGAGAVLRRPEPDGRLGRMHADYARGTGDRAAAADCAPPC